MMLMMFIYWVAFSTWGLIFVPKLSVLIQTKGRNNESMESKSFVTKMSNGFSFVSVADLPSDKLLKYHEALRSQLKEVEEVLRAEGINFSTGTGSGTPVALERKPSLKATPLVRAGSQVNAPSSGNQFHARSSSMSNTVKQASLNLSSGIASSLTAGGEEDALMEDHV